MPCACASSTQLPTTAISSYDHHFRSHVQDAPCTFTHGRAGLRAAGSVQRGARPEASGTVASNRAAERALQTQAALRAPLSSLSRSFQTPLLCCGEHALPKSRNAHACLCPLPACDTQPRQWRPRVHRTHPCTRFLVYGPCVRAVTCPIHARGALPGMAVLRPKPTVFVAH